MAPSIPGAADASSDVDDSAGEDQPDGMDGMDLGEVRLSLEKLIERRLLAPLSVEDQLLWGRLIEREQELLAAR